MKYLILGLLLCLAAAQDCHLEHCQECNFRTDPITCSTCTGFYESSASTGFCIVSARLVIAIIVGAFLIVAVVFCSILKYQEYEHKQNTRPDNIESFPSLVEVTDRELEDTRWKLVEARRHIDTGCGICQKNGGTVELECGHLFHGDCICWHLRKNAKECPSCNARSSGMCKVHCLKCVRNYLQVEIEWYVEIKKRKSRICDNCLKREPYCERVHSDWQLKLKIIKIVLSCCPLIKHELSKSKKGAVSQFHLFRQSWFKTNIQPKQQYELNSLITIAYPLYYLLTQMQISELSLVHGLPSCIEETLTTSPSKLYESVDGYVQDYHLDELIEAGGQATVFRASKGDQTYAVKVYNPGSRGAREFNNEVQLLERLDHRGLLPMVDSMTNVSRVWGAVEESEVCVVVMPYMSNGDLFSKLQFTKNMPESVCQYLAQRLIGTVRYLAGKRVLHRDIKAENILLDDSYNPVLIDFGFSCDAASPSRDYLGDIRYAAPQLLKTRQCTEKSQAYSLGVLFFYLITGKFPYQAAKISQPNFRLLFERKYKQFWTKVQSGLDFKLSTSFKDFFLAMTNRNLEQRVGFDSVGQLAWLQQGGISEAQYVSWMSGKGCQLD